MSSLVRNSWYDCATIAQVVAHHEATVELLCEDGTHIHLKHRKEPAFAPPAIGQDILLCDWTNDYDADCMDCLDGSMHCNFATHGIEPTRFLVFDVEWIERMFDWPESQRQSAFAATFHVLDSNDIILAIVGRDNPRDYRPKLGFMDQSDTNNLYFSSPHIAERAVLEALLNVGTVLGTAKMLSIAEECLREAA